MIPEAKQFTGRIVSFVIILGLCLIAFHYGFKEFNDGSKDFIKQNGSASMDIFERLGRDIDAVIHATPRITINNQVVVEQTVAIQELGMASKEFKCNYEYEVEWLRSTKIINISGIFKAKAGFDLNKPFSIDLDESNRMARIYLPAPQIISCEQISYSIDGEENGWWNGISSSDREDAMNGLLAEARSEANASSLLEDAKKEIESKLRSIGSMKNWNVTIEYQAGQHAYPSSQQIEQPVNNN